MSKEKRRVPKLRFPGFTEDWEQRKLSDISTKVTTKNVDVHYTETLTNSAEQGIISQVDFFDKEISNKNNINGYYIVENNDFIYNPRISTLAPVGPINRNKLNRTGIMSPLYTVFRASNVDLGFLEWYFQSNHWHRYMKLNGDSGARADRIAIKDSTFFEMPIKTPVNIKEQVLIGETLEKFNQYITLHQRKLEHLILKKKSLLQKLFPKNGERYPELRFPGFTDAWEQRKLSDVADVRDGTHDSPKFYNDGFPLVTSKNLKDGSIDFSDCSFISEQDFNEINKRSKVDPGDILFGMIGTIGNPAIVEHTGFAIKNVALIKEGNIINNRFIYHLLSSKVFENYIARENAGGTQKFIALNQIRNFDFLAPTLVEQSKIIELLDCISQNITLHQRKLEHLQLQKKALLQQMFV